MGGYNKITNKNNWKMVYTKMGLPAPGSHSTESFDAVVTSLKTAYKKYLLNFLEFNRKLGGLNFAHATPTTSRHSARPSRNERNWRERHDSGKEITPAKNSRRKKSLTETEVAPPPPPPPPPPPSKIIKEEDLSRDADEADDQMGDDADDRNGRRNSNKRRSIPKPAKKKPKPGTPATTVDGNDSDNGGPDQMRPKDETDSDEGLLALPPIGKDVDVGVNDKIKVRYGKGGKEQYDAKVLKVDRVKERFFVHYNGWNTRYDEWIKRTRIIQLLSDKSGKEKRRQMATVKLEPQVKAVTPKEATKEVIPKVDPSPLVSKRGRPSSAASTPLRSTAPETPPKLQIEKPIKLAKPQTSAAKRSRRTDIEDATQVSEEALDDSSSRYSRDDSLSSVSNQALSESGSRRLKIEIPSSDEKPEEPPQVPTVVAQKDVNVVDRSTQPAKKEEKANERLRVEEALPKKDDVPSKIDLQPASTKTSAVDEDEEPKLKRKRSNKDLAKEELPILTKSATKEKETDKRPDKKKALSKDVEDEGPKKKKARTKGKDEVASSEPPKTTKPLVKSASKTKSAKQEEENPIVDTKPCERPASLAITPVVNEDDLKGKRKRVSLTPKAKEVVVEAEVKETEVIPAKKRIKREEEKSANKDDDNVHEIAKLFDEEEKQTVTEIVPKNDEPVPIPPVPELNTAEAGGSFLLCAEEVPQSPVNQANDESDNDNTVPDSQPSNSTFASAVAPAPTFANASNNLAPATKDASVEVGHCTPPTTPDSIRSGTLSLLTPPHDVTDGPSQDVHNKSTANSATNSDNEAADQTSKVTTPVTQRSPPQMSEDSCSQPATDKDQNSSKLPSPVTASPKKRIRGRKRTLSTSSLTETSAKHARTPIKTRGSTGRRAKAKLDMDNDRYSPPGASHSQLDHNLSGITHSTFNPATYTPNACLTTVTVTSKYNFVTPIDESLEPDKRIQILQDRLCDLRKTYLNIKSEMALLDRRRKKAKRKERAAAAAASSSNARRELDRSISNEFSENSNTKHSETGAAM